MKAVAHPLVDLRAVTYRYGVEAGAVRRDAISDVDLEIRSGELVAFLGGNGAGKSTLARHLNGLLKPTSGQVLVNGQDTRAVPVHRLAGVVGYAFQNPDDQLFASSVAEDISFGPQNLGYPPQEVARRVASAIERLGLQGLEEAYPLLLSRAARRLVALAGVLALGPALLVLDEPTVGLDASAQDRLRHAVQQHVSGGGAAVLISHDMEFVASLADRIVILREGRVVADGPGRQIMTNLPLLADNHLAPPPVINLAQSLRPLGMPPDILDADEFTDAYATLWMAQRMPTGKLRS